MKGLASLRNDVYYFLLVVQLLFILLMPFLEAYNPPFRALIVTSSLSVVLLVGINVINRKSRLFKVGLALCMLFIVASAFNHYQSFNIIGYITFFALLFLFILIDVSIIQMLIKSDNIKPSFIAGSIAGYLMIGISLAFSIVTFYGLDVQPLSKSLQELGFHGVLYFSFVTMTTIGYGEITPIHPFAQTLAMLIGVISQFYMAVVVAVIVGKLMNKRD